MTVRRINTELPGVCLVEHRIHGDARGFFVETYNERDFAQIGISDRFVQDNTSRSRGGVLRGLHYQLQQPQAKLIRVLAGTLFDVVADIRQGSPTFGRYVGVTMSADDGRSLYVPAGYAHAFLVLSSSADFHYKCSDFYAPEHERGIRWDDPDLAIDWPLPVPEPILSDRDRALPYLRDCLDGDLPAF
jgi:dTDP-4-dehydrorhamnose 3,5-epimerase